MIKKQIRVAAGMALAAALMFALWQNQSLTQSLIPSIEDTPSARLTLCVHWLLVPALCLLTGVGLVAALRFFTPTGIDGSRTPESRALETLLRFNQNTVEQAMLAAIAWAGLALELPAEHLSLVPLLALTFGFARLCFLVGYLIAPSARAFGFALTFYPTLGALLWLAFHALAH